MVATDSEIPQSVKVLETTGNGLQFLGAPPLLGRVFTAAEAPAGTDPALWSILTSEERGFFAKTQAMGPLTYGRVMAARTQPAMPAVRGGRLDIRG